MTIQRLEHFINGVNEYLASGVETPLGGYKSSGYGREKGHEALHHCTHEKWFTIKL